MSGSRLGLRSPILLGTAALAVLLALLGTLQYRWLGQVSEAEEARLRSGARARAEPFARDLDRELTRAFLLLQVDAASLAAGEGSSYAARFERWSKGTAFPGLVKDVLVVETDPVRLRRFDGETRSFRETTWPAPLERVRHQFRALSPASEGGRPPGGVFLGPIDDEVPALVLPIASLAALGPGSGPGSGSRQLRLTGLTVLLLDRAYLARRLLPSLAERYFGGADESEYALVVRRRAEPRDVIYRSAPDIRPDPGAGDARVGLFDLRFEDAREEDLEAMLPPPLGARAGGGERRRVFMRGAVDGPRGSGRWELVATHKSGSVGEIVAAARRRNLAVSAGILALLGASAVLIVVSAQRARRLAERQLEFVAGVSHELRTPLAVICSAAENLADGVVEDRETVRQYGRVVRNEGRRLAEMVEQVLDFAGTYSGRSALRPEELDVNELVDESLQTWSSTLRAGGLELARSVEPGLPRVRADRAALGRAVRNLLENAAKHGEEGGFVALRAARAKGAGGDEVRISVEDRGPGIEPAERPHLFEPFFRGRRAVHRQVRGSGLGLSLVDRIVRGAGGRVEVESAPGRGAVFTIALPARPGQPSIPCEREPSHGTPDPAG